MNSPILLLIFNRPDSTRRVFDAIRKAQPPKLYVAADGPRANRPREAELCRQVREIATAVDWPCEVKTLFRESNLGCKAGVAGGVSWFLSHEEEGIILEDDVLPVPTFFGFCDAMLARYRNEPRVSMVSGCNLISTRHSARASYFFSRYNHIWGWATWRRAWQHYDVSMTDWPTWRDAGGLKSLSGGRIFERYWRGIFDAAHDGKVDTWDYQWTFTIWRMGGLTILPAVNQTQNLGFGADATHTTGDMPAFIVASRPSLLPSPLIHPKFVQRDSRADRLIDSIVFRITPFNQFQKYIQQLIALGRRPFTKLFVL